MVAGGAADLRDGTVLVEQTWARRARPRASGDTVTLDDADRHASSYRVVGIFDDNPLVFFPVLTTLRTLVDAGFPRRRQRADRLRRPARPPGSRTRLEQVVADLPIVTVKDEAAVRRRSSARRSTSWC